MRDGFLVGCPDCDFGFHENPPMDPFIKRAGRSPNCLKKGSAIGRWLYLDTANLKIEYDLASD